MPNKVERFTQRARRVLSLAQEEAEYLQHEYIGNEHLLIGLIREDGGVAGKVLHELGLDPLKTQALVKQLSEIPARDPGNVMLDLSPGLRKVLELSVDEARRMGHHYIGTEHLLLGLVRSPENQISRILTELDVNPEHIRQKTRQVLREVRFRTNPKESPRQPIDPSLPLLESPKHEHPLRKQRGGSLLVELIIILSRSGLFKFSLREVIQGLLRYAEQIPSDAGYEKFIDTLHLAVRQYVDEHHLDYASSRLAHVLNDEQQSMIRVPGIGFKLTKGSADSPPNLVIDIAAAHDKTVEINTRIQEHLSAGTTLIWVIYPLSKLVMAYHSDGKITAYDLNSTLDAGDLLPGFALPVRALFTDL